MLKSKTKYIMTWVTFILLLASGLCLMAISWNSAINRTPSHILMILLWILMSASGIYLFMLASKKAHRLWVDDERGKKQAEKREDRSPVAKRSSSKENKSLNISSTAMKLVRRTPEKEPLSETGQGLLKNLAKELEIMSGVVYSRENNVFRVVATYALVSPTEPYSFKEGEGLSGQAAANRQIMVLTRLPEEHLEVYSGLGKAEPSYLAIVPLVHQEKTIAVLECTGYRYDPHDIEAMFRIFARDVMAKLSPNIK